MRMELRHRALDKLYKRRDRVEMPDYQREEVWQPEKKRKLIDTILKGWHLPKLYFQMLDDGTIECVDGQQRLVTIWEFFGDKLKLDDDSARVFGGPTYSELTDEVSDSFDDFVIDIEEIEDASEDELRELFLRLQLGTSLNTAEKLNAIGGDLHRFCKHVAEHSFFADKIGLRDTRYTHFFLTTQWACIEARGIQPQMRFPQLESLLRDNRTFSESSELAKQIKIALEYLDEALPEKCTKLRNRANVLSTCLLASRVVRHGLHRGTAPRFGEFVESFFSKLASEVEQGTRGVRNEYLRYQEAVSYGSTGGDSIRTRINILSRAIAVAHPEFTLLLGDDLGSRNEAVQTVVDQAKVIANLLYTVNQRHASVAGEDLFKMTNRSVAAIRTLSAPCDSLETYGAFVDALYFLVYEGSGSCNRLPSPPPEFAMDVKFLRTGLRHDVDHGKEKEAARKRKRNATVFEKYSGKKSTGECGPEDFLATQLRLLNETHTFLENLLN
jgi:hypothetical protein